MSRKSGDRLLLSEQERAVKTFYLNINVTLDEREVGKNADSVYSKTDTAAHPG
jgi:hypothetical protein